MVRVPISLVMSEDIRVPDSLKPYLENFCLRDWMGIELIPNLVSGGEGSGIVGEGIRFEPARNHGF